MYYTNFLILTTYFLNLLISHTNLFFPLAAASHPNFGIFAQFKDSDVSANIQLFFCTSQAHWKSYFCDNLCICMTQVCISFKKQIGGKKCKQIKWILFTTCRESGSKSAVLFAPLHISPKHISIMACDYFFTLHTETQFDVMKILSSLKVCLYYQPFHHRIWTEKNLIALLLPLFPIILNHNFCALQAHLLVTVWHDSSL